MRFDRNRIGTPTITGRKIANGTSGRVLLPGRNTPLIAALQIIASHSSRNKKTLAAAALLEGESEALTRRAVELALAGDPTAMRLCIERILPPCRERAVKFELPPIKSAADIAPAMDAVTSALAAGVITPGEAGTIAAVVDTFVRAIETSDFERRLKMIEAAHAGDVPEMFGADRVAYSIHR
jgi:hypothetical protein